MAAALPLIALAQETVLPTLDVAASKEQFRQFEQVEVTGSSIVRKEQNTALPVIVVTRDDIRRRGYTDLSQVILNLPSMSNFREVAQTANVAGGFPSPSVHGMRAGTLVLLNGMRLAPYGRQNIAGDERYGYDFRMIPLSAVERIEILADGASSLYGADAIAGVVNIITRKERHGMEVSLERSLADGGVGRGDTLSLAWGSGNLRRNGYALHIAGEFSDQAALNGADRPYLASGRRTVDAGGKTYYVDGANSLHTWPAMLHDTSTGKYWNGVYQSGQCPRGWVQVVKGAGKQPACAWSPYGAWDIYPEQKGSRLHASGELALGGGQVFFMEGTYARQSDRLAAGSWWQAPALALNDPAAAEYRQAVANGMNPKTTQVLWSPDIALSPRPAEFAQESWRIASGMRGSWQGWDYLATLYHASNLAGYRGWGVDKPLLEGLVDDSVGRAEMFSPPAGNNPLVTALTGSQYSAMQRGQTRTSAAELRGSTALFDFRGKEVKLGTGVEYRFEGASLSSSGIPQPEISEHRSDVAGYGELLIPISATWEITGAVRHDQYSDFGGTTNGKVSTKWQATPALMFRASAGTGFRAPSLAQSASFSTPFRYGTEGTPCADLFSSVARALGANCSSATRTMAVYSPPSTVLRPERSEQATFGMRFTPTANVSMAMDLWHVEMRDVIHATPPERVTQLPVEQLNNLSFDPSLWKYFGVDSSNNLILLLPMSNLGTSRKEGVDFELAARQPTDFGRINVGFQGTWMLKSRQQTISAAEMSDLGRFSAVTGTVVPRLRTRADLGLQRADWFVNLSANFVSAYRNGPVEAIDPETGAQVRLLDHRVPSWMTYDLNAAVALSRNLELRVGAINLTNRPAPLSFDEMSGNVFGLNTVYSNAWGRMVFARAILRF